MESVTWTFPKLRRDLCLCAELLWAVQTLARGIEAWHMNRWLGFAQGGGPSTKLVPQSTSVDFWTLEFTVCVDIPSARRLFTTMIQTRCPVDETIVRSAMASAYGRWDSWQPKVHVSNLCFVLSSLNSFTFSKHRATQSRFFSMEPMEYLGWPNLKEGIINDFLLLSLRSSHAFQVNFPTTQGTSQRGFEKLATFSRGLLGNLKVETHSFRSDASTRLMHWTQLVILSLTGSRKPPLRFPAWQLQCKWTLARKAIEHCSSAKVGLGPGPEANILDLHLRCLSCNIGCEGWIFRRDPLMLAVVFWAHSYIFWKALKSSPISSGSETIQVMVHGRSHSLAASFIDHPGDRCTGCEYFSVAEASFSDVDSVEKLTRSRRILRMSNSAQLWSMG